VRHNGGLARTDSSAVARGSSTAPDAAFAFAPSAAARLLHWAGLAERLLTGAARRLRSGRRLLEPAERRRAVSFENPARHGAGSGQRSPVVMLPAVAWSYRFQRPQQLARAFARCGRPVLYVEAFSRARFQPAWISLARKEGPLLLQLRIAGRPDPFRSVLGEEAARETAEIIAAGLRRTPAFVLVQLPFWLPLAIALQRRLRVPLVYDRLDLHTGFEGVPAATAAAEAQLLDAADWVAATSRALLPTGAVGERAFLLRNAFAPEDFPAASAPRLEVRRVGYVGALAHWVDADALRLAAQRLPEWTFEMAGRVESPAIAALRDLPNVTLLGEIPYRAVPDFLAGLSALIIPFHDNPLTRAVDPVKLYEAMAVGIPIVARALPEVARWPEPLVYVYEDPESLAATLARAIASDSPAVRVARRQAVDGETWTARVAQLSRAVDDSAGAHSGEAP